MTVKIACSSGICGRLEAHVFENSRAFERIIFYRINHCKKKSVGR